MLYNIVTSSSTRKYPSVPDSTKSFIFFCLYYSLVGASLSEPHINGTAVRELYIYIYIYYYYYYYGTSVTRNIYAQRGSMHMHAKYSCAHFHL